MNSSLDILSNSLDKKIEVLKAISEYNNRQKEVFMSDNVDMEAFDAAIDEKDRLIEELLKLDEGFESLYERVSDELTRDRNRYANQISVMQHKIALITELSASIQAEEARNKKLIEDYFAKMKAGMGRERKASKAAYDYYKSANGVGVNNLSTFDSKN